MVVKFDVKTVNDLLGIDDAFKAPERLMEILLKKEEREELFGNFLKIDTNLDYDWFHEYFETEQAERKSKKQDFTPNSVARLANAITSEPRQTDYYEMAAGTGGMMITRWAYNVKEDPAFTGKIKSTMADDILTSSIFTYSPRTYWYHLEELSDRAITFLLFNAAIRGINAVIIQCDSLDRKAKRAFYVKNDSDNFLAFSDILEIPKNDDFARFLNVEWEGDPK
ncbi:N-6 DNA methylase [Ligilactobacillus ruminis]|uniref:N-6 DNA methylase n=1 Tax=Ligilactobacillus ruminis TaxID=1623 RepID=UPI001F2BDF78|nr:N-6 DNA methylase [Ligilactobacillus ruminis]MCF2543739.1 N-6 DNA methylase [Ligilactobacillus ruminis]